MSDHTTPKTRAVRAGLDTDTQFGAVVPPIHLTSTFSFAAFGEKRAYDYSRSGNPTRDVLAGALAELEGGAGAVVTASGMAAVGLVTQLFRPGQLAVVPHDCYGGTYRLFNALRERGSLDVQFVDFQDAGRARRGAREAPALVWVETPSNPLLRIVDIAAVAGAARAAGALVVADNTFLSPVWQRPLALGADLVVHSTTKYLNGHSDVVGGAVIAADRRAARTPRVVGELHRRHRGAVRQLPDAARPAHAACPHARARRERGRGGAAPGRASGGGAGPLPGARSRIRATRSRGPSSRASAPWSASN